MKSHVIRFDRRYYSDRYFLKLILPGFVTPTCKKWGYVNEYDEIVNFGCPNRGIVTGFESKHDNHHEDRIWKINCCDVRILFSLISEFLSAISFTELRSLPLSFLDIRYFSLVIPTIRNMLKYITDIRTASYKYFF